LLPVVAQVKKNCLMFDLNDINHHLINVLIVNTSDLAKYFSLLFISSLQH